MTHNKEQQRAIMHGDGPAMVLAGPGAGKTFVITNRVKYLIEQHRVPPEKILVVTFSKAAAMEMKERFNSLRDMKQRSPVRFGTFHSVFFQILRVAYHYEAKDIVTPALKVRFLQEALQDTGYEVEGIKEFIEDIEKEISTVKGEGIDPDCYYSANCPEQVFREIYYGYQKRLQRHRCLDFDDMVVYTYQLLSARKDILRRWQQQFSYILIDEFQDINRLQYEILVMLAKPENNLFIVGDDDQSIYGFRGARPDIMLSFPRHYPGAEKIVLNANYRCSSQILKAAERLVSCNKKRFDKHLQAVKGKVEEVHISRFHNVTREAEKIVSRIRGYEKEHIPYEDMAVLFRTNMQMRILAGKLMEWGVPFTMSETLPNMFETWIAKDILSYVDLALGSRDRELFLNIANRPVRYLSRTAFTEREVSFSSLQAYYREKQQFWMIERVSDFENELRAIRTMSPYSAIHYIRKGIGYDEFLATYAKERNVNPDDWFEILDEILETTRDKATLSEWRAFVDGYGETLEMLRKDSEKTKENVRGVQLMTMHRSKGLEFEVVFVPTLNQGVSPYRKALQAGDIEEERRLLYVAMTRAKKYLHLSFVKERFRKEVEGSQFLTEISPKIGKIE